MTESLSEKLELEPAEEDAVCSPAALEADRREVVGAVARWLERLCPGCRCPHADDIRRELLAPPSPGETWEPLAERERERQGGRIVGDPVAASPGESREPGGSDG